MNIKLSKFHFLIHHHHIAYQDQDDVIWLSANIGRWVNAIADHVEEIGLLFYQSEDKTPQQDTPISKNNVKLHSLGPRKTIWQRTFQRNHRPQICAEAGENADGLLIRGITPHQYSIWRNTPVTHKAFLLVGNINQLDTQRPRSFKDVVGAIVKNYRKIELRYIAENGTLMLANSPMVVSEIEQAYGNEASFVPTNSILEQEFIPLQVRSIKAPLRLLFCGRLDLKKGLRELVIAVAILNNQGHSCQLDIVGAKSEPVYLQLTDLAQELGITSLINWHGFVPYGPNLFEIYQRADILTLPTYTEGFPKVFWEAAANCCPVITTSVGGIPALLEHEEHALLIPPKDADALVAAIERIVLDDALRNRLVTNAYNYTRKFTVEACAEKLVNTLTRKWA